MDYDNTNRGVLFRNERKESETHPDFTGSINFEGVDCWLSGWITESKNGKRFFRLWVKRKEQVHDKGMQQAKQAYQSDQSDQSDQYDDDIPF